MKTSTIDASGKPIGRVATEAALMLMGKTLPSYAKNVLAPVSVEIINASKALLSSKKASEKRYKRYSGYPGGLTELSAAEIIAKKGYAEVFRLAVLRMLPANRLRPRAIKFLRVRE